MSDSLRRIAAAGLVAALCWLTATARAQYAYPYPYGVVAPPPVVVAPAAPVAAYPYLFGGRHFCWYDSAWNGPGWYWCGYAFRSGYGWGGAYGWNGWARGGSGGRAGYYGRGGGHYHH